MTEQDTETEAEEVESHASFDVNETLLLAGLVIAIAVFLGIWIYSSQVASIGVGLISAFTDPVTSFFNGLGTLITDFFTWLGKSVSNLFIVPAAAIALRYRYHAILDRIRSYIRRRRNISVS